MSGFAELRSQADQTRLLSRLCWLVLLVATFGAGMSLLVLERVGLLLVVYGALGATLLGCLGLLARGQRRAAGIVTAVGVWLIITAATYLMGGPRSPAYFAYFGCVLFAAFFWGRGAALAMAGLSALTGLAFVWAEGRQLLPQPWVPITPWRLWVAMTSLLAVTAGLLEIALRGTREALAEAEDRVRQQAAVAELGEHAAASRDIQELLERAVRLVAKTISVEFCKVLELERSRESLLLRAGVGWSAGCVGAARVGTHRESQAGYTLDQSNPVVVEDFATEPRFEVPALLRDHGVASGVSCTIRGPDGAWGVLGAHSRVARRFRREDVHFVQAIAGVLSAAVTRELLQDRVRRAEKLEAMGQLAGGVAHDFNNLLTVISGYAEMLSDKSDGGDVADASREIAEAASRAGLLTQRLLAFARRHRAEPRPIDVAQQIRSLEPVLRALCGERVALRLDVAETLAALLADPADLEQVLLNLAVNARDAMPDGGTLRIEARELRRESRADAASEDASERPWIRIAVVDTGIGMDATTRERAFEPFFTTKEPDRGTGLGLASVYGIVHRIGGEIRLESQPGRGTRFEIDLPSTGLAPQPVARESAPPRRARSGETLLLAEDQPAVRRLACRVLEDQGYRVLAAPNGDEALELAARHPGPIHALVTDVVMPGLGGRELYERLSTLRPGVPAILISGYDRLFARSAEALPRGARLLPKPFTPDELLAEVRAVLS